QEAGLLLQNVEALATGESFPDGDIACIGDGSVDCPFTYLKVEVVYREE
ncbi:NVEALA domain-containing protein, partial [Bacteroides fragilis]